MKLKINNQKINHFFVNKKPNVDWFYKNKLNEVFLFISNEDRLKILNFVQQQFLIISNIKIISFFHLKSQNKNIISYYSSKELDSNSRRNIVNFIKYIILNKFNLNFNFEIINFGISRINEKEFSMEKLRKIVRSVLVEKKDIILPVYSKLIRRKINEYLLKYTLIKYKTIGPIGERKIKIMYKLKNK
ncbi:hypothetical protein [Spiroplasma taiwanense]|uniref:R3H domain-containing protein n=1 Tax=Spiroplasma taiwanense CT-1 TaxID=1276220 RepID=S5MIG6_9MOLU|nr:hypothetical protein [Spiroplasma taiwanense]AGR41685.1 hypothetical protein STAIW_v1c11020 [Spiroplasma taiwanense CT-1]